MGENQDGRTKIKVYSYHLHALTKNNLFPNQKCKNKTWQLYDNLRPTWWNLIISHWYISRPIPTAVWLGLSNDKSNDKSVPSYFKLRMDLDKPTEWTGKKGVVAKACETPQNYEQAYTQFTAFWMVYHVRNYRAKGIYRRLSWLGEQRSQATGWDRGSPFHNSLSSPPSVWINFVYRNVV